MNNMHDDRIKEWITVTLRLLTAEKKKSVAADFAKLAALTESVLELLYIGLSSVIMDEICHHILKLYRSSHKQLKVHVNEFLPSLIWSYMCAFNCGRSKATIRLEACLLALHNLSVVDEKGTPTVRTITVPSLGRNSVYHEPANIGSQMFTETALNRFDQGERQIIVGPFPQLEKINAGNRHNVLSQVMRSYMVNIGQLSSSSHQSLCAFAIRLCCSGFGTVLCENLLSGLPDSSDKPKVRIPVSYELLCEILHCVYFIMFNGLPELGLAALEAIHFRANYEIFPSVLLITNAIRNSLEHNPSGEPHAGPMGVSIAITPACILNELNKDAITNASFKTSKLPDDITLEVEELPEEEKVAVNTEKNKRLPGIRFSARPLKSAFRRVERTITQKRTERDNTNVSPAKLEHQKAGKTHSSASGKITPPAPAADTTDCGTVESVTSDSSIPYADAHTTAGEMEMNSFYSLDPAQIEIVIEPPAKNGSDENTVL